MKSKIAQVLGTLSLYVSQYRGFSLSKGTLQIYGFRNIYSANVAEVNSVKEVYEAIIKAIKEQFQDEMESEDWLRQIEAIPDKLKQ